MTEFKDFKKVEKYQNQIFFLQKLRLLISAVMWVAICWLAVEAIIHISNHGLRDLIFTIWDGPNHD